jgi:hypothetical protein
MAAITRGKACALLAVALGVAGCGSTKTVTVTASSSTPPATTTKPAPTPAQLAAAKRDRIAKAKRDAAAAKTRRAAARARAKREAKAAMLRRKRERAAEIARANAAAERERLANAWHQGYDQDATDGRIYYRWLDPSEFSCDQFSQGCWKVKIITSVGCSYLEVTANETKDGSIVGSLLNNQTNIPAKTPVLMTLEADQTGVQANNTKFQCTNY